MKRLTTEDEKSIMYHLNTFYAKDSEVWVRNGGQYPEFKDVTLVQWIKSAAKKHGLNFTAEDPEHLGDEMYDALQDGYETVEGITALMHDAAVQAAEMRGRLAAIEDILGDDYDLDRLRELVDADRDGRCKITSVVKGEKCGTCRNFCRITGTRRGNCKVRPFIERRWEAQKIKFEPSQSRAACRQYVPE